jgi:hypothetical protein
VIPGLRSLLRSLTLGYHQAPLRGSLTLNANVETFIPDSVKAILLGVIALAFVMARLARAFPDVGWLQVFRLPVRQMSEEQRAKRRRSANRLAGLEIVLAGVVLPFLYFASTFMLFSEPRTVPTIIVTACSLLCIVLGVWVLVRNR